jgi:hypothetical protein
MTEGRTNNPPSPGKLIAITLGVGALATALTLLVVLPAEFGRDPTGFGRFAGLDRLAPQPENLIQIATGPSSPVQFQDAPFRSDVIEIPLVAKGDKAGLSELEYKVRMKAGQTLIYSWQASGVGEDELYFDLHSETPPDPDVKVVALKQANAASAHGSLVAPIDGVHGWYWQNKSASPVIIRVKLSGFYELIAPGERGNKAGIVPASAP